MKLLLDENLSPRLAAALGAEFPGTRHGRDLGLRGKGDALIGETARDQGYCIVSKDDDFRQLSFLRGFPPRVVWLHVGNAGTDAILSMLLRHRAHLLAFDTDEEASLLILP